LYDNILMVSG